MSTSRNIVDFLQTMKNIKPYAYTNPRINTIKNTTQTQDYEDQESVPVQRTKSQFTKRSVSVLANQRGRRSNLEITGRHSALKTNFATPG